jgi:hypothetical protein
LVFLPEFRRFVAPDFLVNFLKDVAHFDARPTPSASPGVRRIRAGLSQREGECERRSVEWTEP